jgi:hypothetical protein
MRRRSIWLAALIISAVVAATAITPATGGFANALALTVPATPVVDGGGYVAVPKTRLLDTRTWTFHGIQPHNVVTVPDSNADAVAVLLTVTVTAPQAAGFLDLSGLDGTTSSINFSRGQTVSNTVVVRGSKYSLVHIFNGSTGVTPVVVDLVGYFHNPYVSFAVNSQAHVSEIPPSVRVLDTRSGTGIGGRGAAVPAHGTVTFSPSPSPWVPWPGREVAVSLNITVTGAQAAGFVTAYPAGAGRPNTSVLNFARGQTISNLSITRLGNGGAVSLYNGSSSPIHLVADVEQTVEAGVSTAFDAVAGQLIPSVPQRLLDTRIGLGSVHAVAAHATLAVQAAGRAGLPTAAITAAVVNLTVTRSTAGGYLSAYGSNSARPSTSDMNFSRGDTVAHTTIVPVGPDGRFLLYNGSAGTVQVVADVEGYIQAAEAVKATAVATTNSGSCAILPDTRVDCWGAGTGDFGAVPSPSAPLYRAAPIPGVSGVTALSGGGYTFCGLLTDATVTCWGMDDFGQAGTLPARPLLAPTPVPGLTDVVQVSVGDDLACALRRDSTVVCWGDDTNGGTGSTPAGASADPAAPLAQAPTAVPGLSDVAKISVGDQAACALLRSGTVVCWGDLVSLLPTAPRPELSPTPIPGITDAVDLSVGVVATPRSAGFYDHACVVRADHAVQCWGDDSRDQLGIDRFVSPRPFLVTVPGVSDAGRVVSGNNKTCGVTRSKGMWCWGALGPPFLPSNAGPSATPIQLDGASSVTDVTLGGDHICAVELDQSVRCAGWNYWGEVGDGTNHHNEGFTSPVYRH